MSRARRPKETRAALLEAAFWEIYENGYQAASLERIIERVEVTKGALYHHFSSKKKLAFAVIDEVIYPHLHRTWIAPLLATKEPIDTLQHVIMTSMDEAPEEALKLGCPLNNLAQELSPLDEEFRIRIDKVFSEWHGVIRGALERGQRDGNVAEGFEMGKVVTFIIATYEGAASLAKSSQDEVLFLNCMESIADYLETLRPGSSRRATA